jgi:nucleoside-diphosphate-sugar epimerase
MTPNKKICILGKNSFVANGLAKYWDDYSIRILSIKDGWDYVRQAITWADIVINCTGVSRSKNESDFFKVNFHYNSMLVDIIKEMECTMYVTLSSIHYSNMDIYGYSQRYKEYLASCVGDSNSSVIIRLPGVYGAEARPNYVSVVSTFFYNNIMKLESQIIDSDKVIQLIHIRKLAEELGIMLEDDYHDKLRIFCPSYSAVTVGNLYKAIRHICNNAILRDPYLDKYLVSGLTETYNDILELEL